jgi:hypothetical protein
LLVGVLKRFVFEEPVKKRKIEQRSVVSSRPADGMYLKVSRVQ